MRRPFVHLLRAPHPFPLLFRPFPQSPNSFEAMKAAALKTGDAHKEWIQGTSSKMNASKTVPSDPESRFKAAKRALDTWAETKGTVGAGTPGAKGGS